MGKKGNTGSIHSAYKRKTENGKVVSKGKVSEKKKEFEKPVLKQHIPKCSYVYRMTGVYHKDS